MEWNVTHRWNMEWNGTERNTPECQWVTLVIGGIYDFDVFGRGLKKEMMLIYLEAWGIREGFGERCRLEAIRGFVGLGAD